MTKHTLTVILPVLNEEGAIKNLLEKVIHYLNHQDCFHQHHIIVVNDGSTDRTAAILENFPTITIITHPTNMGYGQAILSGIKEANSEWILLMDADGQFDISSLKHFTDYIDQYNAILGYRIERRDAWLRLLVGSCFNKLGRGLFGLKLKDINCGFKLIKTEALNTANVSAHSGLFYTNLLINSNIENNYKEVGISHYPRKGGRESGASFSVIFHSVIDIFKMKFVRNTKHCLIKSQSNKLIPLE